MKNCLTQCGTLMLLYERIELGDSEKVPMVKDGYRHFEQWAEMTKLVSNETIELCDISHLLPSPSLEGGERA